MTSSLLGDYEITPYSFPNLSQKIMAFATPDFKKKSIRKRFQQINETLLGLIVEAPKNTFVLPAVLEFIEKINAQPILKEPYHFSVFEFWLNHFSELDDQKNYETRAKIMGKYLHRDDYQAFFPLGMNKTYTGTHFVAAHLSPDVDTMIASFWGWVDAFSARLADGRHIWSLPGGPPDSPVSQLLKNLIGSSIFQNISSSSNTLSLAAIDLLSQKGVVKKKGNASLNSLEFSEGNRAILLVDEEGFFLGDWHRSDVDSIRKIIIRFKSCLRWFENNLHVKLISLFAKKDLNAIDIPCFISSIFDLPIHDSETAMEFTERQKKHLHDFFHLVLGLKNGLQSTYRELNEALAKFSVMDLLNFQKEVETLQHSNLFDSSGKLIENRPAIFNALERIIHNLDQAIQNVRNYVEQLTVAISIKNNVLGVDSQFLTLRSNVEDIQQQTEKDFLPVVVMEENGKLSPVGVVWTSALQKQPLGTVSFRDFCNQEEVRMASYLTPISAVDHHKTSLKTSAPPSVLIGDAQSCNVLIAEQTMLLNDRYSLGGSSLEGIEKQITHLQTQPVSKQNTRLLQRLLTRRMAAKQSGLAFVNADREFIEYFTFLHAILDDTDLLTKVSKRDVDCVVNLLNRMKSLSLKQEVEIINLDDIPSGKDFAKNAAKFILKNAEMYSLYHKIFLCKQLEIETILSTCDERSLPSLYVDTKEQNGCCRVGQTKLFSNNFPTFLKNRNGMLNYWLQKAKKVNQEHPEIDLHLHMISTVASAEEVFEDKVGKHTHQDQLWFWLPATQRAYDHLTSFLNAFQVTQRLGHHVSIEFLSGVSQEIQQCFTSFCAGVTQINSKTELDLPVVILHFDAGLLNSRKAMVTPYLPRL